METTHCLIVHGLMKVGNKYLVIKRTTIKRGKSNMFPLYWDIPGGMVEQRELPTDALISEAKEETNLDVIPKKIIHEDSKLDVKKSIVFTRLVYLCEIISDNETDIKLQEDEHSEYRLISSLDETKGEQLVPYMYQVFGVS